jgi:hypothetical protein
MWTPLRAIRTISRQQYEAQEKKQKEHNREIRREKILSMGKAALDMFQRVFRHQGR